MQEEEIVRRIREKDEAGLAALLESFGPLMQYVAAPILPDAGDLEECLQEAAMRVWEKIGSYRPERGSWKAWVTAITRNTALNMARSAGRAAETAPLEEDLPALEPTPEQALLQKERQAAMREAVGLLGPSEKALFYRKYYYLQSTVQIAAELGMTPRAVEGRLYRIKKRLRRALEGREER